MFVYRSIEKLRSDGIRKFATSLVVILAAVNVVGCGSGGDGAVPKAAPPAKTQTAPEEPAPAPPIATFQCTDPAGANPFKFQVFGRERVVMVKPPEGQMPEIQSEFKLAGEPGLDEAFYTYETLQDDIVREIQVTKGMIDDPLAFTKGEITEHDIVHPCTLETALAAKK